MLAKIITNGENYEKSLKQRRIMAAALLGVGLVGFICYFLLVPGSSLAEYAQGFYLVAATGITAVALVLFGRVQYLLTHPEARQKAKIKETDERERHIIQTAFRLAGIITFFTAAAALFVVLPLSMEAFTALMAVMVLYALTFVASSLWLSKTL